MRSKWCLLFAKVAQKLEVHRILRVDANLGVIEATGHWVVRVVVVFGGEQFRVFALDQHGVSVYGIRFVCFLVVCN